MKKLRFGDFRLFVSRIDPISICSYKTKEYENYATIGEVPDTYNELYVYGVGMIESEFNEKDVLDPYLKHQAMRIGKTMLIARCIESVLSEKPRRE